MNKKQDTVVLNDRVLCLDRKAQSADKQKTLSLHLWCNVIFALRPNTINAHCQVVGCVCACVRVCMWGGCVCACVFVCACVCSRYINSFDLFIHSGKKYSYF